MSQLLCSPPPVTSKEGIHALLQDKGGAIYYQQMREMPVNQAVLARDLEQTCKSRTRTWLAICAHCGMCAESCFFYKTNNNDPTQIPSYKIQSTLGEMLRRKGRVDTEFMIHAMDVAWGKCTCCNRCGLYCPHGIDTGVMFSYLRGILFKHGFVPWEMKIGSGMHRVYGAQMDVTEEDWLETCEWMVEENQDEWPDLEIPVEKEGADVMYILNAREVKHYPEDIAQAAILFHVTGTSWTVPREGWENTSLTMFAGDWEGCAQNIRRIYAAVERLKPKMVVGTECGHAHRGTVVEGPYWGGRASGDPPVPFIHYVEWVAHCLRTGKLKIDPAKKIKIPCTPPGCLQLCAQRRTGQIYAGNHELYRGGLPRDDAQCRPQLLLRRRGRPQRHRPLSQGTQYRPQKQTGSDQGYRRTTGSDPLSQLLGRHQGYDGSL